MPEPGSKKYDTRRARLRKDSENQGISDKEANEEANATLQQDPDYRSSGPRSERDEGPKGQRGTE